MGPLEVMKGQPVSDAAGWLDVNKNTLQHNTYSEGGAGQTLGNAVMWWVVFKLENIFGN